MGILLEIRKSLKKKKESIIFEMYLKNYDGGNFYFSIVYNEKIEKYKVLFIPIDAYNKGENIEEYFCYQFIFFRTVEHIKELIYRNLELLEGNMDNANKEIDSYYIEINMENKYKMTFTQYIDRKYFFLFDIISIIFEHCPNIVSELCNKLLIDYYDNKKIVKIKKIMDFDIDNYSYKDVSGDIEYLEKIGRKYFVVKDGLVSIVEYIEDKKIINIYSEEDNIDEDIDLILKSIINKEMKEFIKIKMNYFDDNVYYYCFDVRDNNFLIINEDGYEERNIFDLIKQDIKIISGSEEFINKLKDVLEEKFEDFKVEEILDAILE